MTSGEGAPAPCRVPSQPRERTAGRAFPPQRRVRRHADYQRIQSPTSRSGRATTTHFVFLVAPSGVGPEAPARLGVVVTKKIGGAVERNRVKRVCRECFRLWGDFVPPGIDLLVIARMGAPLLGLPAVRAEWGQALPSLRHRVREALARTATQPHVSAHSTRAPTVTPGDREPDPA